jgi:LEA14-like dessication related protein
MVGSRWCRIAWVLGLTSCTPLGLWLYEDPVVKVSRVTLKVSEDKTSGSAPVIVALAVDNRNDYDLSAVRVELSLRLNDVPIGQVDRDSSVTIAMDTVSTVAVPLQRQTSLQYLRSLELGTHRFAVRGRAIFDTPIGTRRVRFAQEGALVFRKPVRTSSRRPLTEALLASVPSD